MKKYLRLVITAIFGAAAAVVLSSCAYDPYYSSTTVGGSYSTGGVYSSGYGYGYGGSSFNTSIFVSTGNPRWGYDPYSYSYYDYHRRAYYDPYLYGYYPVGYRPPVVYGVPHPYGWRPGRGVIAPPSRVTNVTVVNYRNRASAYQSTRHDWARQVRQGPVGPSRVQGQRPSQDTQYLRDRGSRYSAPSRTQFETPQIQSSPSRTQSAPSRNRQRQPDVRQQPQRQQENQGRSRSANRFISTPPIEEQRREVVPQQETRQTPEFVRPDVDDRTAVPPAQEDARRQDNGRRQGPDSRQDNGRGSRPDAQPQEE